MKYTREKIAEVMASKGYKYFTDNNDKSYDVNIPAFTLDSPHEGLILN